LGPAAHRLRYRSGFARKFYHRLLAESESSNVFVEAIVAETQADLDWTDVAGFRQNVRDREQPMGTAVTNAHAVKNDGAHLAIEHFIGTRDFFFQRTGDRHQFESRAWLVDVANGMILEFVGCNLARKIGIESGLVC